MIQPYDNTDFYQDIARLRAYLRRCRDKLTRNRPAQKERKLSKLDIELARYRSEHIYLLERGTHRSWQPSTTRRHAAPIWTTVQDAA